MGTWIGRDGSRVVSVRHQVARLGCVQRASQLHDEGACGMKSRKNESGQAVVLTTVALVVLLGMAAFVLDVGNWFRTDRRLQGTADAAALAGAQMLPADPGGAKATALEYANKNGGDVLSA